MAFTDVGRALGEKWRNMTGKFRICYLLLDHARGLIFRNFCLLFFLNQAKPAASMNKLLRSHCTGDTGLNIYTFAFVYISIISYTLSVSS